MKLSKIAVACLALCLVGSAVPFVNMGEFPAITANAEEEKPTSGKCGEDVYWSFDTETGTLTISGTGIASAYYLSLGEYGLERNYYGYVQYFNSIQTVIIENGITGIESGAFGKNFSSITVPKSVVGISENVFFECTNLAFIDVDENNTAYCDIDGVLFDKDKTVLIRCPAKKEGKLVIPDSVETIEDSALDDCSSLTSITIPTNFTASIKRSLHETLFNDCDGLVSIIVSKNNSKYYDIDGVLFNTDNQLLLYPRKKMGDYEIPAGTTSLGELSFQHCSELTAVTIPESLTDIGAYAFFDCSNLSSVVIPNTVKTVYNGVFEKCSSTITILNPECEFASTNWGIGSKGDFQCKVVVYGYENSTAQDYYTNKIQTDNNTEYEFRIIGQEYPEYTISGDLNGDGELSVSDVIEFSQKLHSREALPKNCDLNGDNVVNVIDLALLKRALLNK